MKIKATITADAPPLLFSAFASQAFARTAFEIIGKHLHVEEIEARPAEFFVQVPDCSASMREGVWGVDLRLSNVSRGTREPKQFHKTVSELRNLGKTAIKAALPRGARAQLFVTLMLDAAIPVAPGAEGYSNLVERGPVWVEGALEPEQTSMPDLAEHPLG
jgi:hypothetical protein